MEHISWTCSCAQACWQKVICHWTSERWYLGHLQGFVQYSASKQPVALSKVVVDRIEREHPDEEHAYATVWARLWRILSSVCITSLWIQRNQVTFQRGSVTIEGSVKDFWQTGLRQLRVAKREYRRVDTKIQGARLLLCLRQVARQPRDPSPQVRSPVQPPDSSEAPALLTRLKIYQTSCNHK